MNIVTKVKDTWAEKKDAIIGIGLTVVGAGILIGGLVVAKHISDAADEDLIEIDATNAPRFTLAECGAAGQYLIENHHVNPDWVVTRIFWNAE